MPGADGEVWNEVRREYLYNGFGQVQVDVQSGVSKLSYSSCILFKRELGQVDILRGSVRCQRKEGSGFVIELILSQQFQSIGELIETSYLEHDGVQTLSRSRSSA